MQTNRNTLSATLFLLAIVNVALAQDLGREMQTGEDMAKAHPDSLVRLTAGTQSFVGLFNGTVTKQRRGGVILLHGPDHTPDARDILKPLAARLPERGWDTLAIQAATPETSAATVDYNALLPLTGERIDSAMQYLETRKSNPVVLLGTGTGALAVLRFLADKPDAKIAAAVLIDIPMEADQENAVIADLEKTKKPLLDISSNRTRKLSTDKDRKRKRAQRENEDYRQLPMNDTTSGFQEVEDMLGNRIAGWLQRFIPPTDQPPAEAAGQIAAPAPQN